MSIVDIELSEDVLAMSVDSMKAGETFFGYFLGRHTESDVYQNLCLCLGEFHFSSVLAGGGARSTSVMCWQIKRLPCTQYRMAALISDS